MRPDIVRSDIPGTSLTKAVELSWSYAGLSTICDDHHAAAPPHDQMCIAGETFRNASVGADLGWFTLKSSCPIDNTNFDGLCFILANDKVAGTDNQLTTTLLASADKRRSCALLYSIGIAFMSKTIGCVRASANHIGHVLRASSQSDWSDFTQSLYFGSGITFGGWSKASLKMQLNNACKTSALSAPSCCRIELCRVD